MRCRAGPQFYASVQANDVNQWLETLSEDLLFKCSAAEPGPTTDAPSSHRSRVVTVRRQYVQMQRGY